MKIGVSGHRRRAGADWDWVRWEMTRLLVAERDVVGYTSLAPGADRIFAEIIIAQKMRLVSVVPVFSGRVELEEADADVFDKLYGASEQIVEVDGISRDDAFLNAGKHVADQAERMIFVWDGAPSRGLGGTADIVAYVRRAKKAGVILDPFRCTVRDLFSTDE